MEIEQRTVYTVFNKDYKNPDAIKTEVINRIGKIIDCLDVRLPPKQGLNLLQVLIDNKKDLTELLNIEIDQADGGMSNHFINILDY